MATDTSTDRFTGLLAATAIGVYLLVVVGATTTLTDAAAACPTWPACQGRWLVPLDDPQLAIAWGHRVVALLVGVLALATCALAWRSDAERRVRAAVALAVALYPVQVAIGAVAATTVTAATLTAVHLLVGMAIFAGFVLALAWTLEPDTLDDDESLLDRQPEPADDAGEPAPTGPPVPDGWVGRAKATAYGYFRLMKPRLMWLLCLVASAGMALAAGPALGVDTVVATLTGGVLAIGASGTFNHVLERDRDEKMSRTSDRPTVTDQIPVRNAVAFGLVLAVASVGVFLSVNVLAAILGVTAILFYSVVYTLVLKPNTVQNTVIGGFAGSLPALIGWVAVTGNVGIPALVLAGIIFLWTPAHFYNLALAYKDDYARGGFPMMPVVRGEALTRKHILLYLAGTLLSASTLTLVANVDWLYAATSVVFGAVFLWMVVRLHYEQDESAAFRAFHASNAYLGALLVAIVTDALVI